MFKRGGIGVLIAVLALVAWAGSASASDLRPEIPRGKAFNCVADVDFMRTNHMNLLTHQRDDTLREGIRGERFSLKECISCHAVPGKDGLPVAITDDKHFCRVCHDYAAVSIDCFSCHNSKPEDASAADAMPGLAILAAKQKATGQ